VKSLRNAASISAAFRTIAPDSRVMPFAAFTVEIHSAAGTISENTRTGICGLITRSVPDTVARIAAPTKPSRISTIAAASTCGIVRFAIAA
jgi:hypothetical protein